MIIYFSMETKKSWDNLFEKGWTTCNSKSGGYGVVKQFRGVIQSYPTMDRKIQNRLTKNKNWIESRKESIESSFRYPTTTITTKEEKIIANQKSCSSTFFEWYILQILSPIVRISIPFSTLLSFGGEWGMDISSIGMGYGRQSSKKIIFSSFLFSISFQNN